MLTDYLVPLLAVMLLCALWGVFQIWLQRHNPDVGKRSSKCGACGREDECNREQSA